MKIIEELTLEHIDDFITYRQEASRESIYVNSIDKRDAIRFFERIKKQKSKAFGLFVNGELMGQLLYVIKDDCFHIESISVLKRYQGKGFGRLLLDKSVMDAGTNNCRYMELIVENNNEIAIQLYESAGFKLHKTYNRRLNNSIYVLDLFKKG